MKRWWRFVGLVVLAGALRAQSVPQPFGPMADPVSRVGAHPPPRDPHAGEVDRRRLAAAAGKLLPQRPGVVDAYVLSIALDSDPVFGREAREAGKVLARRYDAVGRALVLAGPDGRGIDPLPRGSPDTFAEALTRIAAIMDAKEDALILYVTAHGNDGGVVWRQQGEVLGTLPPKWLAAALTRSGIRNRLLIVSACYSGVFVPVLKSADGAVITAASADRSSFGCVADNDWTFFGDALVNHALRKAQPLAAAFAEARTTVSRWETQAGLLHSTPQAAIGAGAAAWLGPIETRTPKVAGEPVGQPAIVSLAKVSAVPH